MINIQLRQYANHLTHAEISAIAQAFGLLATSKPLPTRAVQVVERVCQQEGIPLENSCEVIVDLYFLLCERLAGITCEEIAQSRKASVASIESIETLKVALGMPSAFVTANTLEIN